MADRRSRSDRPRRRGGRGRLADQAGIRRQHEHVATLRDALQSELESAESAPTPDVVEQVRLRATALARAHDIGDPGAVVEATLDELFGLGPLEPLLHDPEVRVIRAEDEALWADDEPVRRGFRNAAHARAVWGRILASRGAEATTNSADVRVEMADGSTVRAWLEGPVLHAVIERP